jgi:flagellar basal body-associated protein FliL
LDTTPETTAERPVKKRKRGKRPMIFLGLFLFLALGAGSALYFSGFLSAKSQDAAEARIAVNEVLQLEPFVLNLAGSSALELHYLRVGLSFGFFNPKPKHPVVDPRILMPKLKDSLLITIGKKTAEEMVAADGKENLKQAVAEAVREVIPPDRGRLLEIYLTEFIVQ